MFLSFWFVNDWGLKNTSSKCHQIQNIQLIWWKNCLQINSTAFPDLPFWMFASFINIGKSHDQSCFSWYSKLRSTKISKQLKNPRSLFFWLLFLPIEFSIGKLIQQDNFGFQEVQTLSQLKSLHQLKNLPVGVDPKISSKLWVILSCLFVHFPWFVEVDFEANPIQSFVLVRSSQMKFLSSKLPRIQYEMRLIKVKAFYRK